jgi:hypothetical protein
MTFPFPLCLELRVVILLSKFLGFEEENSRSVTFFQEKDSYYLDKEIQA